jgi:hypothetical protein
MFDHSCGHDRGREDELNVANMQVMWGGKQSKVRLTEIKEEAGFLGPHSPQLKVGDIQYMQFQESDVGPYYMPVIQQQLQRYDEIKGEKIKNRLKKDLCEGATSSGIKHTRKDSKRSTRDGSTPKRTDNSARK